MKKANKELKKLMLKFYIIALIAVIWTGLWITLYILELTGKFYVTSWWSNLLDRIFIRYK